MGREARMQMSTEFSVASRRMVRALPTMRIMSSTQQPVSGRPDAIHTPMILILSDDPVAAALLGALIETLGYPSGSLSYPRTLRTPFGAFDRRCVCWTVTILRASATSCSGARPCAGSQSWCSERAWRSIGSARWRLSIRSTCSWSLPIPRYFTRPCSAHTKRPAEAQPAFSSERSTAKKRFPVSAVGLQPLTRIRNRDGAQNFSG